MELRGNKKGNTTGAGRKPDYVEKHRTALINGAWEFLLNEFKTTEDKKEKMDIVKMILPSMAKTIPQETKNESVTKTEFSLAEVDRKLVENIIGTYVTKLREV